MIKSFQMSKSAFVLFVLSMFCLSACQKDDEIHTYRISKETDSAPPMVQAPASAPEGDMTMNPMGSDMGMTAAATSKEIEWTAPAGWKEQAPSSMRVGSFLIAGENGKTADMSVVPLSGQAGGDLANINRWRGQISLPPIAEAELSRNSQTIAPTGRRMLFVDFANEGRRLMAAIYTQGDRTWFFKMVGEASTVEDAKPAFMKFLRSLHFAAS